MTLTPAGKALVAFALTLVALVAAPASAFAVGSRSISSAPAVVLSSSPGLATVTGTMSVGVTEATATGANPWTLTVGVSQLRLTGGADTISSADVTVTNRSTSRTGGGGTIVNPTGAQDLSTSRTLVTDTQSTASLYTGSYATTALLVMSVPNGNHVGTYTGTLTITLIQ